ncbi:unnamed protein product [Ilex paraguariensis]
MGCAQSKIDNEESVSRCKDRRNLMKEAVSARNAFASGHSGYAMALKNTGAALSDYAHGEVEERHHLVGPSGIGGDPSSDQPPKPPPPPPLMESQLPPPPPPLPNFSPVTPLQRSLTMPEFSVSKVNRKMNSVAIAEDDEEVEEVPGDLQRRKGRSVSREIEAETPHSPLQTPVPPPPPESKGMAWDYFFMVENMHGPSLSEAEDIIEEEVENVVENDGGVEPKTPEKVVMQGFITEEEEETPAVEKQEKQFIHSNTAPPGLKGGNNAIKFGSSVDLLKVLGDVDDHFLKASESAQEVSKMLEATTLHYHSNFADNRGHIDHAARVMRVITWNKSFRGIPNGDGGKDDFDAEEYETHATVLDKLLAWEKKLYEEVKAAELMKLEYQRKVALLSKLKKRSASSESLEKTKAAVSHLHTRYIVDMQSLDSTVSEVNHIRDDQLYPKLVALVHG